MLNKLTPQPPDKIIELIGKFKADTRTNKIDLGVGVYKDDQGNTPVMRAVKEARPQARVEHINMQPSGRARHRRRERNHHEQL